MALVRQNILDAIKYTADLPALPRTVEELKAETGQADPSIQKVGDLVCQDPILAARFLQAVNSAFFSRGKTTSSVHQTVIRLGTTEAKRLASTISVMKSTSHFGNVNPLRIWAHSIAVAHAAVCLGEVSPLSFDRESLETAYAAGLLHDLGIIGMFHMFPKPYGKLWQEATDAGQSLYDAEIASFAISHGEVAELLGKRWTLPHEIQLSLRYHHTPSRLGTDSVLLTTTLVHVADFVCCQGGLSRNSPVIMPTLEPDALARLNLSESCFDKVIERVREDCTKIPIFAEAFFPQPQLENPVPEN